MKNVLFTFFLITSSLIYSMEEERNPFKQDSSFGLESELTTDVIYGRSQGITEALEQGLPINSTTMHNVLRAASKYGKKDIVALLLNQKINPNPYNASKRLDWCGTEHQTPLGLAAEYGYDEIVDLLLKAGVEADTKTHTIPTRDYTPLDLAVIHIGSERKVNPKVVELLLKAGADIKKLHSITLQMLAEHGNPQEIALLLAAGLDPNRNIEGETFLDRSIWLNPGNAIAFINANADITKKDDQGRSYLFKTSNPELLELLLTKGLNPNEADKKGLLPISCVREPEAIKVFLAHGVSPEHLNIKSHVVLKDPELVALALQNEKNKVDINTSDAEGETPLHKAISIIVPVETVELLLKAKADVHVQTKGGWTPLHKSFSKDCYPIDGRMTTVSELLIKYGAKPIKDCAGRTPLMVMSHSNFNTERYGKLINQFYRFEAEYYKVDPETYKEKLFWLRHKGYMVISQIFGPDFVQPRPGATEKFWQTVCSK